MIAPLIARNELLGFLYADIDGAFGRFHDADRDLLAMLASQAAVALDNAQWSQGLEQKVAQRTQELQASNELLGQRANELAVINSVQQGMAASLDFQAIIDLVGDKLRELLKTANIGIRWYDAEANLVHYLYEFEHGRRIHPKPRTPTPGGSLERMIATRRPVIYGTPDEMRADGVVTLPGTEESRSALRVPIIGSDRVIGFIMMEDYEREHAFGEAELRLVATVAAGMGVALENARLFDETQRLLRETEQRSAELAIINAVQQALAGELDIQGVYEAVGDKLREVFPQSLEGIRVVDRASGRMLYPYAVFRGKRGHPPSSPLTDRGLGAEVIRTGRTLLVNDDVEGVAARLGNAGLIAGDRAPKSMLLVPLLVSGQTQAIIVLNDMEREHAFSPDDVRLLETLAGSMSVALENARLFDETQRLLKETERRSSELAVINSIQQGMARDLNFQSIVDLVGDKLRELFATGDLAIHWRDEKTNIVHSLYVYEHGERLPYHTLTYDPARPINQALQTGQPVVLGDRAAMDAIGIKTVPGTDASLSCVFVPVMVGERLIGAISIESFEREHAFGDAEVHLLSTIGSSMGVALENARLLDETQRRARESSALSEVGRELSSTLDLATVMDRIATHAKELLGASDSAIFLPAPDGQTYRAIVALGAAAGAIKATSIVAGEGIIGKLLQSGQPELINDTQSDPRAVQIAGTQPQQDERMMVVPLLSGDAVQGAMAVWRTGGSRFESHDLDFLLGLSRQAAVALKNARLFNETTEALERQTATSEVLRVISGSMADPKPVFDKILESCQRLFGTDDQAVFLTDGEELTVGASRGTFPPVDAGRYPRPLPGTVSEMAIRQGAVMDRASVAGDPALPGYLRTLAAEAGDFSFACAPMTWKGRGIGTIDIVCRPARAFTQHEVALLRTFAEQAVIAIQNARLFNETTEALDQQRASSEVLAAISNSIADAQPVFDTIMQRCQHLFAGENVGLTLVRDDGMLEIGAYAGAGGDELRRIFPQPLDRTSASGLAILDRKVQAYADIETSDIPPASLAGCRAIGLRSMIFAPMLSEGRAIGTLWVGRAAPGAFTDKQVALLRTFAEQAVIAIQNARLFNETTEALAKVEERTRELTESLDYQTAISVVLQCISESPTDVRPVFDAILESATRLFGNPIGAMFRYDGQLVHLVATRNWTPGAVENAQRLYPAPPNLAQVSGRVIVSGGVQLEEDTLLDPNYDQATAHAGGWRRILGAPLLKDGVAVGAIVVAWPNPGKTPQRQIDLLRTFAGQAVIAIENVRLINETREALEQQTATAEVLQVISHSVADAAPVFDKILDSCQHLFATEQLGIFLVGDDGQVHARAWRGAALTAIAHTFPKPLAQTMTGRVIEERRTIHLPDAAAAPGAPAAVTGVVRLIGNCSIAWAPHAVGGPRRGIHRRAAAAAEGLHRQGAGAAQDLRRPGGDRDPERAPVQGDQGRARAADRDRGDPAGDQRVAHRRAAGPRCRRGTLRHPVQRRGQPRVARRERRIARHDELRAGVSHGLRRDASAAPDVRRRAGHDRPQARARRGRVAADRYRVPGHPRAAGPPRLPHRAQRSAAARGRGGRRDLAAAQGGEALRARRDRAAADVRRPGRDRDRERAPVQRDAGGPRAADRDRGGARRHQRLDGRCLAGVRHDRRVLRAAVLRAGLRAGDRRRARAGDGAGVPRDGSGAPTAGRGRGRRDRGAGPRRVPAPAGGHAHRAGHSQRPAGRDPQPARRRRRIAAGRAGRAADGPRHVGGHRAADVGGPRRRHADDVPARRSRAFASTKMRCSRPSPTRR